MIRLTVWGGAGEHGRSCYYVEMAGKRILFDCGVKKESAGEYPLLDANIVQQLDAVFLSHAHEDHSMALPLLVKLGYKGKVWTTRATVEQLKGYFASWEKYTHKHGANLPYDNEHIHGLRFAYLEEVGPSEKWLQIMPELELRWGRSGHLIGSVWLDLQVNGERIFYSGDYCSESGLLMADIPENRSGLDDREGKNVIGAAIIDSAYGMDSETQAVKIEKLTYHVNQILDRRGQVLLPVPAYGRGQDLMMWAAEQFPQTPIYVESELMQGLLHMLDWSDWLLPEVADRIEYCLQSSRFKIVDTLELREQITASEEVSIIFTTDGMMQSDKAQWYYSTLKDNQKNGVILTGHLAKGCFGRELLEMPNGKSDSPIAQIAWVRYKVHQGLPDVRKMLQDMHSKHTVLVHTGKTQTEALCEQLTLEGFTGMHALVPADILEIM